jgi:uroporphyrin-III C-methyltransferase
MVEKGVCRRRSHVIREGGSWRLCRRGLCNSRTTRSNEYIAHSRLSYGSNAIIGAHISDLCRRHRVPVNVADAPQLCSFTLLSTHTDGPLQIGITTNGKGCKLASRIRREISSTLPPNLGAACARLGTIRRRIQIEDHLTHLQPSYDLEEDESLDQSSSFNRLVTEADFDAAKNRRIRWLSQICEYWPLDRLAAISDTDVEDILNAYKAGLTTSPSPPESSIPSLLSEKARKGRVILAGSGPGHPDLLTHATLKAILTADLVLADKLVPSRVLDLIPRRTPVQIARKFPGNADQAQEELLALGLAGAKAGKTVLRLKQGDPYIYGRGGEEFEFFCKEGFGDRISVLPGITSALSAPLFAGIPPTQRGISDQILICTGTGRRGAPSVPPEYVPTRTVVFLMALHRISSLVEDLTTYSPEEQTWKERRSSPGGGDQKLGNGAFKRTLWPTLMPCAVIERASCPDQRVIRSTLAFIAAAIEEEGSRPPGLLVIGNACETLTRLDVSKKWIIEEGFRGLED